MNRVTALVALAAVASTAHADRAYPVLLDRHESVIRSDAVVVGTVKKIETEPGEAGKVPMSVAQIEVSEALFGAKGLTQVKVRFPAGQNRRQAPNFWDLKEGQTGCFFLVRRAGVEEFVPVPDAMPLIGSGMAYEGTLKEARHAAGVIADPLKALAAPNLSDRAANLRIVLMASRSPSDAAGAKSVDVPADELKAIVRVARELPWAADPRVVRDVSLQKLFPLFEPARHGFTPPAFASQPDYNDLYGRAAKEWLAEKGDGLKLRKVAR